MAAADIARLVDELGNDRTSGAAELARRAAQVLVVLAEQTRAKDSAGFREELSATGKSLIEAQPSMAPLFNLVNSVLWSVDELRDVDEARETARAVAQRFADELGSASERIALEALALLSDGCTVLTHSRSSTVLAALLLAGGRGLDLQVVCTESRPLYEGRTLAQQLASEGIRTTLITDGAVAHLTSQADLVMVGADSVSRYGLVNKVGTHGVALAAKTEGIPFYTLCGSEKFLPANYLHFKIERKDSQEVWPDHPGDVSVLNYYFDLTPLDLVSGLVTEDGLLSAADLEELLAQLKVHQMLQR